MNEFRVIFLNIIEERLISLLADPADDGGFHRYDDVVQSFSAPQVIRQAAECRWICNNYLCLV